MQKESIVFFKKLFFNKYGVGLYYNDLIKNIYSPITNQTEIIKSKAIRSQCYEKHSWNYIELNKQEKFLSRLIRYGIYAY